MYRIVFSEVLSSTLFGTTTNFTNKDNAFGFIIIQENIQAVNEVGSIEWIATNTNTKSLTKPNLEFCC